MRKFHGESKIPRDWVVCPECNLNYGFINCRITTQGKNRCLKCHIEMKKLSTDERTAIKNE